MFTWLRKLAARAAQPCPWSVAVIDGVIITSDGQGAESRVKTSDLKKVVVATDDSGPWGADVVFLLYAEATDPIGIFLLEAQGCQDFVAWLSNRPGVRARELSQAMASTSVARFEVYQAPV